MAIWNRGLKNLPPPPDESRYSFTDWVEAAQLIYSINGNTYGLGIPLQQSPSNGETIDNNFVAFVNQAYKSNGIVFAVSLARALVFSEVRFQFRDLTTKRLYGGPGLEIIEHPWPNGTTGELLLRAEQDVTNAGNFYVRKANNRLYRMQPDRVTILIGTTDNQPINDLNSFVAGYLYNPAGTTSRDKGITLTVDEVMHWSPIPDPLAMYRGMSWVQPAIHDVEIDKAATAGKASFFDHAMTPNYAIRFPPEVATKGQFDELVDAMKKSHTGPENMFKTLYLAAGADPVPLGVDPKTGGLIDIQSVSETRVCADGRVPAVIVGFTTGLEAATYSNFGQARRQLADGFARPQWRSFCAAIAKFVDIRSGSELWYDESDVAMLREDAKQAADTTTTHAASIVQLVNGGFIPASVLDAVTSGDLTLLEHSGLMSVQLQAPVTADAVDSTTTPTESDDSTPESDARDTVEAVSLVAQRLANGPKPPVGTIMTEDEARALLNRVGADLTAPYTPPEPPPPPEPTPDEPEKGSDNEPASPDAAPEPPQEAA